MMLGPTTADPTMDLSALDIVKTVVVDSPNKLFVGGLPCEWAEDQARVTR
jgi:splicing factor U2AF subunit